MAAPCEGLRVVDFSRSYPGALATMVLADAGAEVIKVEPPQGDPTRKHYASVMWHRGKKSVALEMKTERGQADARRLAATADAVVESFRPGVADRLGVGYEALREENSALVYCSISGFGPRGPLAGVKGYEGIVAAAVGRLEAFSGMVEKDGPIYGAMALGSYGAAMLTVQGMMAALRVRDKCGRGQKVETSLLQALTCYDLAGWIGWQLSQRTGESAGATVPGWPIPAYMPARTRDGYWLQMGNHTVDTQRNFLGLLGLTHLREDPRYENMPAFAEAQDQAAVHRMCLERLLGKDRDEWMELFVTSDVAGEPFRTTQEGLLHEQVLHNGDVIEVVDPALGPTRQLGPLARFSETPVGPKGPSPEVGRHTQQSLAAAERKPRRPLQANAPLPAHPLAGVTVLELASYIAVPFMTCLLADLGARVIKVEPITGDLYRSSFPRMCKTLQGKQALSLDLKAPQAQEVLHRLVKQADILVHNYRPGVPERLGIDYETLREVNPRLIYVYAGAYGSTGPHSHRTGFHTIAGAITGGPCFQLGRRLPPPPDQPMTLDEVLAVSVSMRIANETNPDPVTALASATAAMLALYAREQTGTGQYLETSMIGCNLYAHADDALTFEGKPERMLTDVDYNGPHALYRLYRTKEGWLFLACPKEEDWAALAQALGMERLAGDPRFRDRDARLRNDEPLAAALQELFFGKSAGEWQELLTARDVACVQVFGGGIGEFLDTAPFVKEQGFIREVEHPSLGRYWRHGPPWAFSETPGDAGPNIYLGEHTRAILRELGYDGEAIAQMEADGVAKYTNPDKAAQV